MERYNRLSWLAVMLQHVWNMHFLPRRFIVCLTLVTSLATAPTGFAKARNIVFILTDDHRYDAMGFLGHPWLETPNIDRLAKGGVHFPKAMVTTSLCSPSRATVLTGLYAHNHSVVDNYNPVREDLVFFPQLLQKAGFQTAFIGKWHMGDVDNPQRGFDHWAAFKGQGTYWPDGHGTTRVVPQTSYEGFNINGERRPQKGYITDELTDMALEWLESRQSDKPYFLYISHKAVHSDFVPADRHRDRYKEKSFPTPKTMADTEENYRDKPMWLKNQRNSRHGADFGYNLPDFDVASYYKRYHEALLAVDDSLGRLLDRIEQRGELESTLIVYMGDNGFQFGEHGLIDKRVAYEHSIRIPLLFHCPELFKADTRIERTVANIDIAPTILEVAGVEPPDFMDGMSFLKLATGDRNAKWREHTLYEYYWEQNYPQTPTMHALVGDRFKYIRYHGLWDSNELYDFTTDPDEATNLIDKPEHAERVKALNSQLFDVLEETSGSTVPLARDRGSRFPWRHPERAKQGRFPDWMYAEKEPKR